jgi:hypothetical protein
MTRKNETSASQKVDDLGKTFRVFQNNPSGFFLETPEQHPTMNTKK